MYRRYSDRVDMYAVYIREAHPVDGWRTADNESAGIRVETARRFDQRAAAASLCCEALRLPIPLLVDGIDDAVATAYSGFPDRLYVIDREGRVAYKGARGPFGFEPREAEQALLLLLADEAKRFPVSKDKTDAEPPAPALPQDPSAEK